MAARIQLAQFQRSAQSCEGVQRLAQVVAGSGQDAGFCMIGAFNANKRFLQLHIELSFTHPNVPGFNHGAIELARKAKQQSSRAA